MDPGLPELVCNCQQIQQVILNLLTNARDALNEKFEGYHRDKIIRISCSVEIIEGQKKLAIRVRDNGNGIRKDIQDKIFDPFFTSKDRNIGTGLGLAISYGIVRDHGGKIGFTTKEGEFTEFYVLLPLS
jgi:signal transduction histidine kinase